MINGIRNYQSLGNKHSTGSEKYIGYDSQNLNARQTGDHRMYNQSANMMNDKAGIGNKDMDNDMNQFRMSMSKKYQQYNEDRAKGLIEEQRCYICQTPGHKAKDCKYGLT